MPEVLQNAASELLARLTPSVEADAAGRLAELAARSSWHDGADGDLAALCHALLELAGLAFAGAPARARARAFAVKLYGLERALGEGLRRSTLYRGAVHVAAGQVELGLKNVQSAMRGAPLGARERCVAAWARASAGVQLRRLRLARESCADWIAAAEEAGLTSDTTRARLGAFLLDRLLGRDGAAPECEAPWQGVAAALDGWTEPPPPDSPAVFLGVGWDAADAGEQSFEALCAARRRFSDSTRLAAADDAQLEPLCALLARWDAARPLQDCMEELGRRKPRAYFEALLARQLGSHAARELLDGTLRDRVVTCEAVTVLMADVCGYTSVSEQVGPGDLHDHLSPVFRTLNEELEAADGMILEFVGDAIMVVFNGFDGQSTSVLRILNSLSACLQRLTLQGALARLVGETELRLGIGLHKGDADRGYVGGLSRCHLAVLGSTVNVAARVEALTRQLPCPVALTDAVLGGAVDFYTDPESVTFSLRDLGHHRLKGVSEQVHVYGLDALIREWVDFVPMGFVAESEPGIVYLDTGCGYGPGLVDSHRPGVTGDPELDGADLRSTCSAILAHPEYVLEHLGVDPANPERPPIELRVHHEPDLDCVASLVTCYELLQPDPRLDLMRALADYVSLVDEGVVPNPERIVDSLYGVFVAHLTLARRAGRRGDRASLLAGLRVVDAALFLAEAGEADFSTVFAARPGWFPKERELLREDSATYVDVDAEGASTYRAWVHGAGEVEGIWLDHPQSLLFKHWARTDPQAKGGKGYPFMAVDWSDADRSRYVFSVAPDSGLHLDGLGQALEAEEKRRRADLGQPRPVEPRRHPADNADPWYFGQGHGHTIVDSPTGGTVLTREQVRQLHQAWRPPQ